MKHTMLIAIERNKTTGFSIKLSAISKSVAGISGKATDLSYHTR